MVIPTSIIFDWTRLGSIRATKLHYARDEMHNAVQLVALMGKYLLPQRDDDSQTSMQWYPQLQALVGEAIGDDIPDMDMLRECGISIAVANAVAEVKAVSNYQTASNDDDGVAMVLEQILSDIQSSY